MSRILKLKAKASTSIFKIFGHGIFNHCFLHTQPYLSSGFYFQPTDLLKYKNKKLSEFFLSKDLSILKIQLLLFFSQLVSLCLLLEHIIFTSLSLRHNQSISLQFQEQGIEHLADLDLTNMSFPQVQPTTLICSLDDM